MDIPYIEQNERPGIYLKELGEEFSRYEICVHVELSEKCEHVKSEILKKIKSAVYEH